MPITVPVLHQIHAVLGARVSEPDRLVFWAIATSAFFGFFCLGVLLIGSEAEYSSASHLSWGDVALDSKATVTLVKIHLKRSQCDQFGTGADILLGCTGWAMPSATPQNVWEMASTHRSPGSAKLAVLVYQRSAAWRLISINCKHDNPNLDGEITNIKQSSDLTYYTCLPCCNYLALSVCIALCFMAISAITNHTCTHANQHLGR